MLVETFGGLEPALVEELRKGAEWRANKLTASEYDETTWSARTFMAFTTQRLPPSAASAPPSAAAAGPPHLVRRRPDDNGAVSGQRLGRVEWGWGGG